MSSLAARFSSTRTRRLAERALAGRLGRRARGHLTRRLGSSNQDRHAYGQLARMVTTLEGGPALTSGQRERVLDEILLRVGRDTPPRQGRLVGAVAAAAAAAAVVVAVLLAGPRRPTEAEFQPRGRSAVPATGRVGLRAFCVRDGEIISPPAARAGGAPDAACRLEDELQLTLTHTQGFPYLLVIGVLDDTRGELHHTWYHPVPPTGAAGPAPQDVVAEPLGESVRLSVNHRPGRLRLVALFSQEPFTAGQVLPWLETLGPSDSAAELLRRTGASQGGRMTAVEQRVIIRDEAR